jgi:predicted nucleic acid-binding protein
VGRTEVIILDTNILSELVRATPAPAVLQWAHAQDPEAIFTTAICEAELLYGVAIMADGQRRDLLTRAVQSMLNIVLAGRVLPFDRSAASVYAKLGGAGRREGRPTGMADLQIAAIARARSADAIATRNVRHFAGAGVAVVDPWQAGIGA